MTATPAKRIAAAVSTVACLAAAALTGCGAGNEPHPGPTTAEKSLSVVSADAQGRLRHFEFESPALGGDTGVDFLLPRRYDSSAQQRYPSIYLLHGGGGNEGFWSAVGLDELLRDVPAIVVMPDGDTGFYSDPFNDGLGGPPAWETYHVEELIAWVDQEFRTIPEADSRAVAGISMGGLGAYLYAARHPDKFAAAASYSGIVQSEPVPMAEVLVATGRDPGILGPIWGPYPEEKKIWQEHNPVALAAKLDGMELVLVTGDGQSAAAGTSDPIEEQVHAMNVVLHRRLDSLGIPHLWDTGPGVHDVPDWRAQMERTLPAITEAIGAAGSRAPAPAGG